MKEIGMINGKMFRMQLSGAIMLHLASSGCIEDNEQAIKTMNSLAQLFKDGIELEDFSYQFIVTDLYDNEKYIA